MLYKQLWLRARLVAGPPPDRAGQLSCQQCMPDVEPFDHILKKIELFFKTISIFFLIFNLLRNPSHDINPSIVKIVVDV